MRNRKPNAFEKALLVIGVAVLMVGYALIHRQVLIEGFSLGVIQTIFLWFILVALIIITAANENIKEELRDIIELQLQEIRLLREEMRRRP